QFELAGEARICVLVSVIEPRKANIIMKELVGLLPLDKIKLGHLKRIRSSQGQDGGRVLEVILSPPEVYHALNETKKKDIEERFSLKPMPCTVPKLAPRTRRQFDEGQRLWPMLFHHSTSEEALRAARVLTEQEREDARTFMRAALQDAKAGQEAQGGQATVGAVMVDPYTG
ncbi:unnamed protein product, partial [Choristocarpus tenellus]